MSIPPELENTANLAFLAQLLAHKEGAPVPQPPASLTMPLPEFIALLNDPDNRAYVVRRLSIFVRPPKPARNGARQ
jgi:hypothetical protein